MAGNFCELWVTGCGYYLVVINLQDAGILKWSVPTTFTIGNSVSLLAFSDLHLG